MTRSDGRYHSLDMIKGIAMIMVILVHYSRNFYFRIFPLFRYFQMGCPIFFVASGFGIMSYIQKRYNGSLELNDIKRFYISRFKALAPGWYVGIVIVYLANTISLAISGQTMLFGSKRGFWSILCNALFLHGLNPYCNNNVMLGGWYIGATMILYILTPFILKAMRAFSSRLLFFLVSVGAVTAIWFAFRFTLVALFTSEFGYYIFLVHYPEYLLGIMLYYTFKEERSARSSQLYLILGVLLMVLAVIIFFMRFELKYIASAWLTALSAYCCLYFMMTYEKTHKDTFSCKALEAFGKDSYYIFLIHGFIVWPFAEVFMRILEGAGVPEVFEFCILIPVVVFFSYATGRILKAIVNGIMQLISKAGLQSK